MRFTNNPYEEFMKEKSYFKGVPPSLPPKGSRCDGCPYWRGIGYVFCYREPNIWVQQWMYFKKGL